MNKISLLLKSLDILYKDLRIYTEALTHPSFNNESSYSKNYQRLEFLGDAILDKHISVFLYKNFPDASEGVMSLLRSKYVRKESLSKMANDLNLKKYIQFGKSVKQISDNILEDIFEALVGAIYIDIGEKGVKKFLEKKVFNVIKNSGTDNIKNPKTLLQEYLQSESRESINYLIKNNKGSFEAKVFHNNNLFGIGKGKSKKKAEVNAAINALERLGKIDEIN